MKKILLIVAMIFVTLNLHAAKATTNGPDENGRLYGHAFFDIETDVQSPVLGAIKYSKRAGFDWNELFKNLKTLTANTVTYKVSGRIEIPKNISSEKVYITLGKDIKFWKKTACCGAAGMSNTNDMKATYNDSVFKLTTFINGEEMLASSDILTNTKDDGFGARYVEYEIRLFINIDKTKYAATVQSKMYKYISSLNNTFKSVKLQAAPKSRSYKNKWVNTNIYVMDDE